MTRNRLYLLLGTALAGGYAYLAWALLKQEQHGSFSPCPLKNITGIACPSCGSTRSVLLILNGNFTEAMLLNPLGFAIAGLMAAVPLWMVYDMVLTKTSLFSTYKLFEEIVRKKGVAIVLVVLVVANWIWNITKGL